MTVLLLAFCVFNLAASNPDDHTTQLEKYNDKVKTYQLDVPGKEPITIVETAPVSNLGRKWDPPEDISNKDVEIKNLMTHIVHDFNGNRPRCFGPSCQEGFDESIGPHEDVEDMYVNEDLDKLRGYRDLSKDRLQAISALAAKLKKDKLFADRFLLSQDESIDDDNDGKIYTSWNRLKVKQHKHPFDDKDGWVTLEPVAWSTSKISKWKPNVKKQKPNSWDDDENSFPSDDKFTSNHEMDTSYNYQQKRPSLNRPGYINNKLHLPTEYDIELPSKPSWTKPQQHTTHFQSSWAPDESRRPHKHNCDSVDSYPSEDSVYYEMPDTIVTDSRPTKFPHDYEALHQSNVEKRPYRRPTMYGGMSNYDDDRSSRPPYGDGQWVLLSTTKGYRNKKRQRSLNPTDAENTNVQSITAHKAVGLTVLPADETRVNMTTSHGGLLEVERSFQTVEESKIEMDKKNDLEASATQHRPVRTKIIKRKVVPSNLPDSSTVFAAVGAGMLPATMAMVVPMMLGRRRKRGLNEMTPPLHLDEYIRLQRNE
ncbi:uncharacterized protein LOC106719922 [Papilio machaon]|uniref:uncharacterized protein LOC106719922 n=1 Tax=Papilio machaon TaxID=76193 RepID=UPI001E66363A|nr:uncharacterized protein LOC106719922 [Papilio machaon]